MKPCIVVLGKQNAGKSTVVQSLTGCPGRTFRGVVRDKKTKRGMYVMAASPQEKPLRRGELGSALRTTLRDPSIIGAVMAIQPTVPRKRKDLSMEEIFRAVKATRRLRPVAFLLDPPYDGTRPASLQDVQARLRQFGVRVRRLDGRRFAYLNARAIRKLARIP